MNEINECSDTNSNRYQPYQITGLLSNNLNKTSQELKAILKDFIKSEDLVYYYIVRTLDFKEEQILQKGTGPNFQGGMISLCTCKHWMRTFSNIRKEKNLWIAGLTGKNLIDDKKRKYLYYLMKVNKKYESHFDAWSNLPDKVKQGKNAAKNKYGDVFEPKYNVKNKFDPSSYKSPVKEHPHNRKYKNGNYAWYKDVMQYYKKPFVLLFGDPKYSFIWTKPNIPWNLNSSLTQGQRKITIKEFLNNINLV